jgi:ribosomal protein L44E
MYVHYIKKFEKKGKKLKIKYQCVVCVHGCKDDEEEVSKWLELVEAGQISLFGTTLDFRIIW